MNEEEAKQKADTLYGLEVAARQNEKEQKVIREELHQYMKSNRIDELPGFAYLILKVDNPEYDMPSVEVGEKILGKNIQQFIIPARLSSAFREAIPPELAAKLCPITKRKQYITLRFKNETKQLITVGVK
jgi:hypothetical protein